MIYAVMTASLSRNQTKEMALIVSRLDYLNKMKHLLSDNTKFKSLTPNPTKAREGSLSFYLRKLRKDRIIDDTVFQKILPGGSS